MNKPITVEEMVEKIDDMISGTIGITIDVEFYEFLQAIRKRLEEYKKIKEIIHNSYGVVGWHLNGDVATWEELEITEELVR